MKIVDMTIIDVYSNELTIVTFFYSGYAELERGP